MKVLIVIVYSLILGVSACTHGEIVPKDDCTGYFQCVYGDLVEMSDCPDGTVFSPTLSVCVIKNSIYDDCSSSSGQECVEGEVVPKDNCKGFFLCSNGNLIEMPDCPDGTVFSATQETCVHIYSEDDDCTENLTVDQLCDIFGGLVANPNDCHSFYNCSLVYEYIPRFFEQHMDECIYPDQYNIYTKQCDSFQNVHCGNRANKVDGCDYRRNKCAAAHCIPCEVRFPSCNGSDDGNHEHSSRLYSPYYIVCFQDRLDDIKICPRDSEDRPQLFHPDLDLCVELEYIPQEHGGLMPDCTGKADGLYSDEFGRCNRYYECYNGKFANSLKCVDGLVFNESTGECVVPDLACGNYCNVC